MNFAGKLLKCAGVLCCILFFTSSGPFDEIDSIAREGHYDRAIAILDQHRQLYGNDDILFYLDKGMLTHYAGQYSDSIRFLSEAERAIEEAFTRSVTEEIGSMLLSDNTKTYAGEDYENIYINVFNALNYYHLNRHESALVEVRRISEKLRFLEAQYQFMVDRLMEASREIRQQERLVANAVQEAARLGIVLIIDPENTIRYIYRIDNLVLARYLSMLFYRANGLVDSARIDYESILAQYADLRDIYNFNIPSSLNDELVIPAGMARLNILAFTGLSPLKNETSTFIRVGNTTIRIALPEMRNRPSEISQVKVEFVNGDTFTLERLEDIEAIARETFNGKIAAIRLKSNVRAGIRGGIGAAARNTGAVLAEVGSAFVPGLSLILSISGEVASAIADAVERADIRISRFFPRRSYVGGINLRPGTYSFRVQYYNASGQIIDSFFLENVQVRANALNLVESISLK